MNIGIVTTWLERGATIVSRQYISILRAQGHSVFVFARGGESFDKGCVDVDTNIAFNPYNWSFIPTDIDRASFEDWINLNDLELIIFNEQQFYQPILWAKYLGVRVVAYVDYYTDTTLGFFELYDALICNTKQHLNAFKWHHNALFLPWGTDTNIYSPKEKPERYRGKKVFFHSAGMNPIRKGTDILLESFNALPDDIKKSCMLVIHTQVDLSRYIKEIDRIIQRNNTHLNIEIINGTVSAPGLYHLGDVYVYPSRLDGIGLTLIEAVSSGLGIITSDAGPMNEFVHEDFSKLINIDNSYKRSDGYYWPVVEPNVPNLSKLMQEYVLDDDALLKTKAREHALRYLDFEKNFKVLSSLLEKVEYVSPRKTLVSRINTFEYKYKVYNYFSIKPLKILLSHARNWYRAKVG